MYEVKRHDGKTAQIGVLGPGGIANASAQDEFCEGSSCIVSLLFDQSANQNHLSIYSKDQGVGATGAKTTLGGQTTYGMYFNPGNGYRNDKTTGVPKGEDPESMYMVVYGQHFDDHCCFDYGGGSC